MNGEKLYNNYSENNNLLSEKTKKFICDSSCVELFEFFSTEKEMIRGAGPGFG